MKIVTYIIYLLVFFWIIFKSKLFYIGELKRWVMPALFALKVLTGLIFYLIFTRVYNPANADIIRFYNDGVILHKIAITDPVVFLKLIFNIDYYTRDVFTAAGQMINWDLSYQSVFWSHSRGLITYHALLRFLSFGNFHTHNLVAVFAAFAGQVAIFKTFLPYLRDKKIPLLVVVFAIPSVLFWSSAVLKEAFAFFGLGAMLHSGKLLFYNGITFKRIAFFSIAALVLFMSKIHILMILMVLVLPFLFIRKYPGYPFYKYLIFILLGVVLSVIQFKMMPEKNVYTSTSKKFNDFITLAESEKSGSLLTHQRMEPTPLAFLMYSTSALKHVFFSPSLFNADNLMQKMTALENLILLFVYLFALFFIDSSKVRWNLFWFVMLFGLLNLLLIGYTVPVAGAIIRYKSIGLQFILIGFLLMFDIEKFRKRFG